MKICTAPIGKPWEIVNLKKCLWQNIVQIPAICVTTSQRVVVVVEVVEVVVDVLYGDVEVDVAVLDGDVVEVEEVEEVKAEVEVVVEVATCQIDEGVTIDLEGASAEVNGTI